MATAPATPQHKNALVADSITITCPPIPGGGGSGLLLQPTFKVCGTYTLENVTDKVGCFFKTADGAKIAPRSLTLKPSPFNTWSANFVINAGTNGTLHAFIEANGAETASADVANLQVVASGGGTCTC